MLRLAIDPGITTGIATQINETIVTLTTSTPEELFELVCSADWDVVIYEEFTSGGQISKYGQETIRLIGGVRALCWKRGIKLCRHMPQNRYCAQAKAHQMLLKEKHVIHQTEALAHLLAHDLLKH